MTDHKPEWRETETDRDGAMKERRALLSGRRDGIKRRWISLGRGTHIKRERVKTLEREFERRREDPE